MNTPKYLMTIIGSVIAQLVMAQTYIPYYPPDWDFKKEVDLVDFSQVKSVTTNYLTLDGKNEIPVYKTYLGWNGTYQLTDYQFVNFANSNASFDVRITYANAGGNQLKSVTIINPTTRKTLEEWQYTNGSFDVNKIDGKRYLLNLQKPDEFTVLYEGNDDDFLQETVFSPQKTIDRQTRHWYTRMNDGTYKSIKKRYLGNKLVFDQTDSLLLNKHQKKMIHYVINEGKPRYTRYIYKSRKLAISGDTLQYQQLESLVKDGKDFERYEYDYDERGNWILCKVYRIKFARWERASTIRREIDYRN